MTMWHGKQLGQLGSEVSICWRTAARRERQQLLITLSVVALVAALILAGLLV